MVCTVLHSTVQYYEYSTYTSTMVYLERLVKKLTRPFAILVFYSPEEPFRAGARPIPESHHVEQREH